MLMKRFGFTLVELMIALVVSAILFTAMTAVFTANMKQYQKTMNIDRLNQQLESVLSLMSQDIRRAGYWSNASGDIGTNTNNNPFVAAATDISVNAAKNCILFTYDHNKSGALPAINSGTDDDRYGYQLSGGAIQIRPVSGSFSCAATNWENMTDTNVVNITALVFTLNTSTVTTGPGTQGITIRDVTISITGQLANDATVSNTLTQNVRILNDKFIP